MDRDVSLDVVSYSRLKTEFTLIEPGLQSALDPPSVGAQESARPAITHTRKGP